MKLKVLLELAFNMTDSEFTDDQMLIEMEDWDSMNHMIFITQLEKEFQIVLTGDEIADLKNVGDIKKLLLKKGIAD